MRKLIFVLSICATPILAIAEDKWVTISPEKTPGGAWLINIGNIQVNENGNQVATIRNASKGFHLDIVTEFDCTLRRTRSLASSVTDDAGHLITARGLQDKWSNEPEGSGLNYICR